MRNGLKIFDADAHVVEPKNLWERFLEPKYKARVTWQQPIPGMDRFRPALVDGRYTQSHKTLYGRQQEAVRWTTEAMVAKYGDVVTRGFDGAGVAESMKAEGVDLMVLYGPGYDMWVDGIDPDLQAGMARAYNRWAEEMRETSGGRVLAAGPVPLGDVTRAVDEVVYAYEKLGIRSFWARPNPFNHRTLGDRYFDPLYEVLQSLDVPFSTHEFMGLDGPSAGADRFESFVEWHACVHPMEAQMAMLSMITRGVFERFPRLRVGSVEHELAWIPFFLDQMDYTYTDRPARGDWYRFKERGVLPSEFWQRNCFASFQEDATGVRLRDVIGVDAITWGSDYPHTESTYPRSREIVRDFLAGVPAAEARAIVAGNAARLYGFELPRAG